MTCRTVLLALAVLLVTTSMMPTGRGQSMQALQGHAADVMSVNERFQQVFGPAPALASAPFLGLAVLTGAALLVDQPVIANSDSAIARELRGNLVLRRARRYASWWLFGILVLLALATAALNSGKLQGSLGKAVHLVEAGVVAAAYVGVVLHGSSTEIANTTASSQVAQGIAFASVVPAFDFGHATLIVTAGIALIPLMFVRFAFDVLIWLSPFPFVDAFFQLVKNAFALLFLVIYLINPVVAALVALLFYVPALFLLPWAARLFSFAFRIVLKPFLARISSSFGAHLQDRTASLDVRLAEPVLVCSANVVKARGFKRRQSVAIIQTLEHALIQPLRKPAGARALAGAGERILIGKALAWIEVQVISHEGRAVDQIALPYSLAPDYQTLCHKLGAQDVGDIGVKQVLNSTARRAKQGLAAAAHAAQDQAEKRFRKPHST